MLITAPQNRRIHQLLHMTNEVAWKQDWVEEASNYRVHHSSEMTVDEANMLISMLQSVKAGHLRGKNPMSVPPKAVDFFGRKVTGEEVTRPADPQPAKLQDPEPETAKCQRLRRKILYYCHMMQWYQRNSFTNTIITGEDGRPKLDYGRIDQYCIKHSRAHKPLNKHTSAEMEGKGGLIYQFEIMAKNYTNRG